MWLLCDRGGEHIQEKNKGIYDKRQTKAAANTLLLEPDGEL